MKDGERKGSTTMCEFCDMSHCLPACPNFDGYLPGTGEPVASCGLCGAEIYPGERYIDDENCPVCPACAADMQLDELVLLAGAEDLWEMFGALGLPVSDGRAGRS